MDLKKLQEAVNLVAAQLVTSRRAQAGAAVLLALSLLPRVNSWATRRKENNYVTDGTWDWTKETVLVTGGSSGIGMNITSRLSAKGVKVIVLDIVEPQEKLGESHIFPPVKFHATARPDCPKNTFFYKADLNNPSDISSTAERIRNEHGDPTVLINNAGVGNGIPLLEVSQDRVQRIFGVNIVAPILLVKEFLPSMIKHNHGHIVNLASLASFSVQASNVDYCCTKAAILALHEGLGQELRHIYKAPCVRTTSVHPSWVKTPMIEDLLRKKTLSGAVVTADDVAQAIVNQLYSGYGARLVIPGSMSWTSMVRGVPGWLRESLMDVVSLDLLKAIGTQ